MELIKPGKIYDFMGMRRWFLGLSFVLVAISIASFFYPGPKWGTDFKGGTEIEVAFTQPVQSARVREAVEASGFHSADVVALADPKQPNRYMIRVQDVSTLSDATKDQLRQRMCFVDSAPGGGGKPEGCTPETTAVELRFSPGGDKLTARYEAEPDIAKIREQIEGVQGVEIRTGENAVAVVGVRDHKVEVQLKSKGDQLMDGLRQNLGAEAVPDRPLRVEWIGPKAGAQLRDAALKSIAVTLFVIIAYIALRYDIRFAPGAILALLHDVGVAAGAMVLTNREISLSTIAAMLTILGYSITDTVVVYDRIRENLGKHRNMPFPQLVNLSVSEMLGRTIISQGTAVLSMLAFLFWGTQTIKDFAFALFVGIIVGTYSSIYIAAPFTEWVDRKFFSSAQKARPKVSRVRQAKRAENVV
jgi:preprotein translocase subunit SecF